MCEPWTTPTEDTWDTVEQKKHLGCSKKLYERSVIRANTGVPRAVSQYDPTLPYDYICKLELDCALGLDNSGSKAKSIRLRQNPHTKFLCTKADRIVGFSNGHPTQYIFVVVNCVGRFHGYPITLLELNTQKGLTVPI